MANLVVADTDLLIDYLNGAAPGADMVSGLIKDERLAVTTPSVYELHVGIDQAGSVDSGVQELLGTHLLILDEVAAIEAGKIDRELADRGMPIGQLDCLIAGTCRSFSLPLATRNRAHFERVDGLELVDF